MIYSKGFSLIEVLITLVLTTIGILGMVALQGRSIQYAHDSSSRNNAVMLTNELVEIMRGNRNQILTKQTEKENPIYTDFSNSSIFFKRAGSNFSAQPIADDAACDISPSTALEQRNCWAVRTKETLPLTSDTNEPNDIFRKYFYICRSSVPGNCNDKGSMLEIQIAWQVPEGACQDTNAPNNTTCILRTRVEL
ncbi:type IV pilus modification protein PilV [compost metagenome]